MLFNYLVCKSGLTCNVAQETLFTDNKYDKEREVNVDDGESLLDRESVVSDDKNRT